MGKDRVQEVDAVLARLGLGRLSSAPDLAAYPGRNENWTGRTDQGHRVFVKRLRGPSGQARHRLRRSVAFEQVVAGRIADVAPASLGWDEPALLQVWRHIDDAESGADLAVSGKFGIDLAMRAGDIIGSVHDLSTGENLPGCPPGDRRPVLPSAELLRGLSWPAFFESSAGELQAWQLMQDDQALAEAVDYLLGAEEHAPRVPTHCDLRLDQFLLAGGRLHVTDWEEFRLADAARDVGSFAGELLHRSVTGWADLTAPEPLSHEQVVRNCADGIEKARQLIAAFWSGYLAARPGHSRDRDLAVRATAFAGWHLFDRLLAAAGRSARLGAMHRAAAGIGRAIMRAPARSAETIGLG
jgi:hypothetical protein